MNPHNILELTQAIVKGDIENVQTQIEQIKPHFIPPYILHMAAHMGNLDIVRLLIQKGADPDLKWCGVLACDDRICLSKQVQEYIRQRQSRVQYNNKTYRFVL